MKLLTIDIGNTNIVFGLMDSKTTLHTWRVSSQPDRTDDEYAVFLDYHFKKHTINVCDIKETVICSVVPAIVPPLFGAIRSLVGRAPLLVGHDIHPEIKINLYNPGELGIDRIVNSYAAYKLYRSPAIIVDFGTATTFDIIADNGDYMGGVICPGIKISLEALSRKTAQLPKISPQRTKNVIGKSTVESILSGSYHGYNHMISGLIGQVKREMAEKNTFLASAVKVIATGGFSNGLHDDIKEFDAVLSDLTLRGIFLIYSDSRHV